MSEKILVPQNRNNLQELSQSAVGNAYPYNPAREIETSLVGLLKHQIEKLKDSEVYINAFQEAILARLGEASFMELVDALSRAQASKNSLMEKILSPVIPKAGSTAPLLEQQNKASDSEAIAGQANKETLQALTELTKVLSDMKKDNPESENDVKKALNLDD